jgi:uncharacterized phage infection (PIP) family protein YhgE
MSDSSSSFDLQKQRTHDLSQTTEEQIHRILQTFEELFPSINSIDEKLIELKKEREKFIQLQKGKETLQNEIKKLQQENKSFQITIQNFTAEL